MLPIPFGFMGLGLVHFFDDFTRGDSDTVGRSWIEEVGDFDIVSNQLQRPSGGAAGERCIRPASEEFGEGWAEVSIINTGTDQGGPVVRLDSGNGYYATWTSATALSLTRLDSGSPTAIGSATSLTRGSGDVIRVEALGTTIKVYEDGNERISATDATYSSGVAGVRVGSATVAFTFDDFQAQEV